MQTKSLSAVALISIAGLALLSASATAQDLTIIVRPARDGGPEVKAVEFREEIKGALDSSRPFSLRVPITYAGRTGIADRVTDLVVRDSNGDVPLKIENDPVHPGGFPFYRHWRAERPVSAPVTVTYKMQSFTGTVTVGPQFDFYSHGGGISSGGMALFVLPETLGNAGLHVKWDLSDLAPGSIAASSYGQGDFNLQGSPERLAQAYYMAGPAGHYAPSDSSLGFNAYWLGQPTYDSMKEMEWTYEAYRYLKAFYRDTTTPSYTVFVRALAGTGGGTAVGDSFMVGTAPGTPDPTKKSGRGTIFHEMGHKWVGGISGGSGQGGTTWFGEGLNVHFTRVLLLRSGLAPIEDYEKDINSSARGYYSNPYHTASAAELSRLGFSTGIGAGSAQNVAYTRGSLYFADMDAKIRTATKGRHKLDDVILALFERRRSGEEIDQKDLVETFAQEIGQAARDEFESVIVRGEEISPESGAFGPCFKRQPKTYSVDGKDYAGFEWVRVASIPDAQCRRW